MRHFWHFARLMFRQRLMFAGAMLCALLSAGGLAAGLATLGPMLEIILKQPGGQSLASLVQKWIGEGRVPFGVPDWAIAALPTTPSGSVALILLGLAALTVFGATCNFLHQYLSLSLCTRVIARVRLDAFRHAVRLPLVTVVQRGPAEFTTRVLRNTAELQGGLVALTSRAVSQATKGVAGVIVAVWFDWRLVVVAIVAAPVLGILLRKFGKRIRRGVRGTLTAHQQLLRVTNESLQGLRGVKTAAAEAESIRRFNAANKELVRQELKVRTARALASPLLETMALLVVITLAYFAAGQILHGSMSFDDFVLALASLGVAGGSFRPLTMIWTDVQASAAPAEQLRELLDTAVEEAPEHGKPELPRHNRTIRFESVDFTYPGAPQRALCAINLEVRSGEHIALVGPNGCGKTTLVSVLARLLRPESGRVQVDGADIAQHSLRSLRAQMGFVTQETILIGGSIAENIAFGCRGTGRQDVERAAVQAHADSFIRALPGGYDAEVAEQGASLSGGQRQRLAIARAVLRDPAILVLDEATSQIDAQSEEQIHAALAEFGRGRTVIAVAHRLSTMLAADRVVVMDEGRIIDQGAHETLMNRCDLYRQLVRSQMTGAAT